MKRSKVPLYLHHPSNPSTYPVCQVCVDAAEARVSRRVHDPRKLLGKGATEGLALDTGYYIEKVVRVLGMGWGGEGEKGPRNPVVGSIARTPPACQLNVHKTASVRHHLTRSSLPWRACCSAGWTSRRGTAPTCGAWPRAAPSSGRTTESEPWVRWGVAAFHVGTISHATLCRARSPL
jgi:hypothetical protein